MKYIQITRLVVVGIGILSVISTIRSMRDIKKEDPLREIKRDLLFQKILIYLLTMMVVLSRTSIFLWL